MYEGTYQDPLNYINKNEMIDEEEDEEEEEVFYINKKKNFKN